jgi:hypothetical protein
MNDNGISKEYEELVKTFLRLLNADATRQVLDDTEHITRIRFVLEGIRADVQSHGTDAKRARSFFEEMRAYARKLFIQSCTDARASYEDDDDPNEAHEDGVYFDELFRGESPS